MKRFNQKNNSQVDFFNFYAINLLEKLGDMQPSQTDIDVVEDRLKVFCKEAFDCETLNRVLQSWENTANRRK